MHKPVILLGNGLRHAPATVDYLCSLGVPVLVTRMACDLVPEDCPVFCGRPGVAGQRAANIIQQKADVFMTVGARMDEEQRGFSWNVAPHAKRYAVDIDEAELNKFPDGWMTCKIDLSTKEIASPFGHVDPAWLAWCKALYARFRPELDGVDNPCFVDPFRFISQLSELAQPTDVLAIGSSSTAPNTFLQAFKVKRGQRVMTVCSIGAMGADIPMAIGACIGSGGRRTICVTGDGGFMLNMHELELVHRLDLPIKYFVYANGAYGSIRNMQDNRFKGHHVGCDPESGFTIPDLYNVAHCFGIDFYYLNHTHTDKYLSDILNCPGAAIV